jgi:colanic acid/amylovoran biosynthesis glycosyltransferase
VKINIVVDVYPHPFKNYFDTQFADFVNAGHEVSVLSVGQLGSGDYSHLVPHGVKVTQLQTLRTRPLLIAWLFIKRLCTVPSRIFRAFAIGIRNRLGIRETINVVMWAVQLPGGLPDLYFAHNLAAARRFWFLRDLCPTVPYVIHYHGGEVPGVPQISSAAAKRAFSTPDIVFTNTQFSKSECINRGCPAEKISILPVGFRISDYVPDPNRRYRQNGSLRVLTIGRASAEKGFLVSLEAIRRLVGSRGFKDFHYTIIGDGPELPAMRAFVEKHGLGERVRLFGWATRDELTTELKLADVFILPSLVTSNFIENQACIAQEAMLMQVPVIASDIGGVRESVAPELRPLMFEPGNAEQLTERLSTVAGMDASTLAELGRRGREFAARDYDIVSINQKLLKQTIARNAAG